MKRYLEEHPGLQRFLYNYQGALLDGYRWEVDEFAEDWAKNSLIEVVEEHRSEARHIMETNPDEFYEYFVTDLVRDYDESKEEIFATLNAIFERMAENALRYEEANKHRYPDMSKIFREHVIGHVVIQTLFRVWPSFTDEMYQTIASRAVEKFGIDRCQSFVQEGTRLISNDLERLRDFLFENVPGAGIRREGVWEVLGRDAREKWLESYFEFLEQAIARAEKE